MQKKCNGNFNSSCIIIVEVVDSQKKGFKNRMSIKEKKPDLNTLPIIFDPQATILPRYAQYPQWLNQSGVPPTARIVYFAIFNRMISFSLQNHVQYSNDQGHLFVIYTNDDLARDCGITLSAVKAAKKILKTREYIRTEKINGSNAIRIYPHFPSNTATYHHAPRPIKSSEKTNSSFDVDEFFDESLKKHLSPEAYDAYCNSQT